MYRSYIHQVLSVSAATTGTAWKNDIRLDTPKLLAPENGDAQCPANDAIAPDSGILLEWGAVGGATAYILQWALNSSFTGPTVRSIRTTDTSYMLQLIDDIRMGDEIQWRVMAINDTGGTSLKSATRTVKYECPAGSSSGSGGGQSGGPSASFSKCQQYDIKSEIIGPDNVMCCDRVDFKLNTDFQCKDANGRDILEMQGVNWWLLQNPMEPKQSVIENSDEKHATVKITCSGSQEACLMASITFLDKISGATFSCPVQKCFHVDCAAGLPKRKPWLDIRIVYGGSGLQTYTHPAYWAPTLSPSDYFRGVPSTLTGYTLVPSYRDWGGPQLGGYIPVMPAVSFGPVVRTSAQFFPEKEGSDKDDDRCATQLRVGQPVGEKPLTPRPPMHAGAESNFLSVDHGPAVHPESMKIQGLTVFQAICDKSGHTRHRKR